MTIEFHVISIPLFHWSLATPDSFSELSDFMEVTSRFFCFKPTQGKQFEFEENRDFSPVLGGRIPHITECVPYLYDISEKAKQLSPTELAELKIKRAFASDYGIELVSEDIGVFSHWNEINYESFCVNLFSVLYNIPKPSTSVYHELEIGKVYCNSIVTFRFALCDDLSELQSISKGLHLASKNDLFYFGGAGSVNHNAFNFVLKDWSDLFLPNTFVTLKPEKLSWKEQDEILYLFSLVHLMGKFYVITQSCSGASANLEWSLLYIKRLFEKYDSSLGRFQKFLSDSTKSMSSYENRLREKSSPITLLSTSPSSIQLMQEEYGDDFLGIYKGYFRDIITGFQFKEYVSSSSSELPLQGLVDSLNNSLITLATSIDRFLKEFRDNANRWKEDERSNRTKNQLLVALSGVIVTLIIDILKTLFP